MKTPLNTKTFYGVFLCCFTAFWFSIISIFLSNDTIRSKFLLAGHWFDRIMGITLILFSFKIDSFNMQMSYTTYPNIKDIKKTIKT